MAERARLRFWPEAVLCLLLAAVFGARAASVTASVDRPTVTLGETVTLSITFDGVATASQPQLPPLPNFQVAGTGQRSEFAPGRMRQTYEYHLVPNQPGDFVIPAFQIQSGGQTYSTQPISLKVLRPGSTVPGANPNAPAALLKLVLPKKEFYAGEMFVAEIQLYATEGRFERPQLAGDGFDFGKMPDHTQTQAILEGRRYNLISFRVAAMPVRIGTLTLGPATTGLQVNDRGRGPDWFGFFPTRRLTLATDPESIRVLPLPTQDVPASFAGAVGTFSLQVSAAPTNVAAGDPVTVKIQIAGAGPLESLSLPAQADWREFKTYPPESKVSYNDALGVSGVKSFDQVVIPQNHEVKALPPFVFSYFDPNVKAYRTLKGPAIPLEVRPAGGPSVTVPTLAGVSNRTEQANKDEEILRIKVHLGTLSPVETPLFRQGWFMGLQLVPPALWLGLVLRRKHRESLARNPRLLRQRQVAKMTAEGLEQLRRHAAAAEADPFFALVFRLLQEQIGERLDLPASAITEAVVDERLRPLGVDNGLLDQLHQLFQECNLARYAAVKTSSQLDAMIPRLASALESLRGLDGANGR